MQATLSWRRHQSGVIEILQATRVVARIMNAGDRERFTKFLARTELHPRALQDYLAEVRARGVPDRGWLTRHRAHVREVGRQTARAAKRARRSPAPDAA